jgi:hypothetical protein
MHLEAGPVWSDDSERIAILERELPVGSSHGEALPQPQEGRMAVTIISTKGLVVTVPVPSSTRDNPSLTWIGNRVAVGSGTGSLVVDPSRRLYSPLDADSAAAVENARTANKVRDDGRGIDDELRRLGAREGVARAN